MPLSAILVTDRGYQPDPGGSFGSSEPHRSLRILLSLLRDVKLAVSNTRETRESLDKTLFNLEGMNAVNQEMNY